MKEKTNEKPMKVRFDEGGLSEVPMPFDKNNMMLIISLIFFVIIKLDYFF